MRSDQTVGGAREAAEPSARRGVAERTTTSGPVGVAASKHANAGVASRKAKPCWSWQAGQCSPVRVSPAGSPAGAEISPANDGACAFTATGCPWRRWRATAWPNSASAASARQRWARPWLRVLELLTFISTLGANLGAGRDVVKVWNARRLQGGIVSNAGPPRPTGGALCGRTFPGIAKTAFA